MTEPRDDRIDAALLRLVGVMVLGGVMSFLDATIVNVGIHTLTNTFTASLATIEWVTTGYLLAAAVAIPVAGWATERFGTKRMWLAGLTVLLVGSALCAVAWSPGSLIAFRLVQGFGGGLVDPIMMAVVAGAAGPKRIGRVMGLIAVPINLGPILGPILGGLILGHLSWQWMFLINVPVAVLAIVLAIPVLPADPPRTGSRSPFDTLGVLLLCPGFAALVYALSQAGTAGFGALRVMIGLTLGVVLFAGYVAHALRARVTPLIDLRLFASPGFTASVSIMFLVGGTLFSLLFLLPLYYQQVRVHNVFTAGLLVMPLGVGAMTGMPVAGRLADTLGAKLLVPIGGALIAAGALVYRQADAGTPQVMLTASQVVIGLGLGLVGAPTMGSVYRTVVSDKVGAATAAVFILNQTGASLGIAIAAFLIQRRGADDSGAAAFGDAFWWPLSAGLVILVAGLLLPGRPQSRPAARATEAEAESAFAHPA